MSQCGSAVFALSCLLLIRGILAALRQNSLSVYPNWPILLSLRSRLLGADLLRPDIWTEQPQGGIEMHQVCPLLHKRLLKLTQGSGQFCSLVPSCTNNLQPGHVYRTRQFIASFWTTCWPWPHQQRGRSSTTIATPTCSNEWSACRRIPAASMEAGYPLTSPSIQSHRLATQQLGCGRDSARPRYSLNWIPTEYLT